MDSNTANSICVLTVISSELLARHVVNLVLIACYENDSVIFQQVNIVPLVGVLAHQTVEALIPAGNFCVWQCPFNVIMRVEFIYAFKSQVFILFLMLDFCQLRFGSVDVCRAHLKLLIQI
jgi:hypothetical protein